MLKKLCNVFTVVVFTLWLLLEYSVLQPFHFLHSSVEEKFTSVFPDVNNNVDVSRIPE